MSRIYKSSNVNLGDPVKVTISDELFNMNNSDIEIEIERSSDMSSDDPSFTASNTISNANHEANEIIQRAHDEAKRIVESAMTEAETEKRSITQKGYEEGFQAGLIDGKRETEDLAQQALEIKQELEEERDSLIQKMEQEIPEIVMQCVRKIIGQEIEANKEIIVSLVSMALKKVSSSSVTVKVSESDFGIVEEKKNEILSENRGISECCIKMDKSLDNGDCIIETDCGDVDASINSQIGKLEEIINEISGDGNVNQ